MTTWLLFFLCMTGPETRLTDEVGRREFRVYGETFALEPGLDVVRVDLPGRLDRQGYKRVHARPTEAGTYFWGTAGFYVFNRAFRRNGHDRPARLIHLQLTKGRITAATVDGAPAHAELPPEVLCESLEARRAARIEVRFADLPAHVWQPLIAAEDARFFDHVGLDGRAIARGALANLKAGAVKQGGSTLTQQLIKGRDLTPKRTFGRKASEAWRALWLEARYDKEEILEAYLNHVYMGHVGGYALHGYGAAARAYFNKHPAALTVAEAAALAAMVQGPNRLSPLTHPEALKRRRDWVLSRMATVGSLTEAESEALQAQPVVAHAGRVQGIDLTSYRALLRDLTARHTPRRARNKKGLVLETTLDPVLQELAEQTLTREVGRLRRRRGAELQTALVCLDARSGALLAYVGGFPGEDQFDRARNGARQAGSLVKPFILLEAFDAGRGRPAYHAATRIADEKLTVDLPSGAWQPRNHDRRFHGVVTLDEALRRSYNVPFVRLGLHLGEDRVADVLRDAGLNVPRPVPPAILLGALEATPLDMAAAFTVFSGGRRLRPLPLTRIETPGGRRLEKFKPGDRAVADAARAWQVDQLLQRAVAAGTGHAGAVRGVPTSGKTGTSSDGRDAWFAGRAGSLVTVVWVGYDSGDKGGLTGGEDAAPIFGAFMNKAVPLRPEFAPAQPHGVSAVTIDPVSGLRVGADQKGALDVWVTRASMPGKKRWWRKAGTAAIIR